MNSLKSTQSVGSQSTKITGTLISKVWRTKGSALSIWKPLREQHTRTTALRVISNAARVPSCQSVFTITSVLQVHRLRSSKTLSVRLNTIPGVCQSVSKFNIMGALINRRFTGKKRAKKFATFQRYCETTINGRWWFLLPSKLSRALSWRPTRRRNSGWQTVGSVNQMPTRPLFKRTARKTSGWTDSWSFCQCLFSTVIAQSGIDMLTRDLSKQKRPNECQVSLISNLWVVCWMQIIGVIFGFVIEFDWLRFVSTNFQFVTKFINVW